ncbi:hypothetical protein FACS1894166_13060 [Bacilli bacterium]|nr:hypothetical protein FACS1894166_13060 [Bacilli bacterium]
MGGLVGGGFGIGFAVAHFSNSKNPDNPVNPGNTIYQLNPSSPALALDINNATNANVTFAPTHNGEPTSDLSIQLAEHQESEHVFDYVELRNGALV